MTRRAARSICRSRREKPGGPKTPASRRSRFAARCCSNPARICYTAAPCESGLDSGAAHTARQPLANAPRVLREECHIEHVVIAASVALIEIRAAARGAVAGKEEDPVIVVEIAVGAGHVLALEVGAPRFAAELNAVGAA